MLKIGIIGSGDIARKAYLPVISKRPVELHFFARNETMARDLSRQFGIGNLHASLESLLNSGVTGAFVHTSTTSHHDIVEQLLSHNINVYVDKPLTYDFASSARLFALAKEKNLQLMVGFNRRYAPAYWKLRELENVSMLVMQKNRKALPADVRTFIFDDFIHVVDTLLYLTPHPYADVIVTGKKQNGLLHHVIVQLISANGFVAVGIMNRDSGTVEEKLEVFTPKGKWVVNNVTETVVHRDRSEMKLGADDWESTLYKRGFDQIVDEFLLCLQAEGRTVQIQTPDPLMTHQVCEEIVAQLLAEN